MIRFLHAADIHLDSPLKGLETHDDAPVEEIRGATRRAFVNLVDLAIEEEIDFLLIAGDLYDGDWKDYNTGLFFAGQMGRMDRAGIKVFIVSGNHDAASQITKNLPLPDNVTLFPSSKPNSIVLDDLGIVIHGQSYETGAVTTNLAALFPKADPHYFNIGLLHTSLTGREGHENYAPCTLDDLKSTGYEYWGLGHIHKCEVVCEDPVILFPGNIQGRHIKETGSKGATLVTVEDGRIKDTEFRELDALLWSICRIDVSPCETREAVYEEIRKGISREKGAADNKLLALRLVIEGTTRLHSDFHVRANHWAEEFKSIAASSGGIWLEKVKYQTQPFSMSHEELASGESPFGSLLQAVEHLELDEGMLNSLVPDLVRLKTKLPAELLVEESILEGSPQELEDLKKEVKELLVAKLIQQGGDL